MFNPTRTSIHTTNPADARRSADMYTSIACALARVASAREELDLAKEEYDEAVDGVHDVWDRVHPEMLRDLGIPEQPDDLNYDSPEPLDLDTLDALAHAAYDRASDWEERYDILTE